MTKGFVTVVSGDYYCKLAKHLYMSYKLFANCDLPFYVITDSEGEKQLSAIFDGIIIRNDLQKTTVDKMFFFTDAPFDQNIFIDADSSFVSDANYFFDVFEKNGSDISAIALVKDLGDNKKGIQFGVKAIEKLDIKKDLPGFNGGVYYYKKSDLSRSCIDFMMNDVLPNYHYYGCLSDEKNTVKYDEPVVILGMLKFDFVPVHLNNNIMYLVQNAKNVKWNLKKKKCSFIWYNDIVSPTIIHWKVGGTETFNYEKYSAYVEGKYYLNGIFWVKKKQIMAFGKYYIYPKLLKIFPKVRNLVIKNR